MNFIPSGLARITFILCAVFFSNALLLHALSTLLPGQQIMEKNTPYRVFLPRLDKANKTAPPKPQSHSKAADQTTKSKLSPLARPLQAVKQEKPLTRVKSQVSVSRQARLKKSFAGIKSTNHGAAESENAASKQANQAQNTLNTRQLAANAPQTAYAPPQIISRTAPVYPRMARKRGIEGRVAVSFTVTAQGKVENIVIEKAEPPQIFEQAVLDSLRQWHFHPATQNGLAVSREMRQVIGFNLKE